MDSIPIVVFTGQVPTALIGNDAFQEVDIVGITRPCTKHNYLVKDINDLAQTIQRGLPHRPHRPARPGADGSAQGRGRRPVSSPSIPRTITMQELQAHLRRHIPADRKGRSS